IFHGPAACRLEPGTIRLPIGGPVPFRLQNPFWQLSLDSAHPQLTSLGFDATGQSRWCANLLKTRAPRASHLPLTIPCHAQSGYVDAGGTWQLSASGRAPLPRVASESEVEIDEIAYGNVREHWKLRLEGAKLEWTIRQ